MTVPGAHPPKRSAISWGSAPAPPGPGARYPSELGQWKDRPGQGRADHGADRSGGISGDAFQAAISARSDSSTESPDRVTASWMQPPFGI